MEYGAIMNAVVKSERHRPSPLLQGGLEIPLTVTVEWENESLLKILSNRIESVGYHMDTPYTDGSKSILKELGLEQDSSDAELEPEGEGDNSDEEMGEDDDDDDDDDDDAPTLIRRPQRYRIEIFADEDKGN